MGEAPPGVVVVELAGGHVTDVREVGPVADGHGGDPVQGAGLDDLVDGAPAGPLLDGGQHVGTVAVALDVERLVGGQVRALDHVEEGVPLGGGDGGHPHVAVEAALDARDHDVGGTDPLAAGHGGGHRRVADEGEGQALERRHVDQVAPAGASSAGQRTGRPQGPEGADRPLGQAPAHRQRLPVVGAVAVQGAAQGLEQEIGGHLAPTGPAETEGGEAHHHQLGAALDPGPGIVGRRMTTAPVAEGGDDDHVGGVDQRLALLARGGRGRVEGHTPL